MYKAVLPALLLLVSTAHAQKKALPFFVGYEKGKAYILLVDVPRGAMGFHVARKSGGDFGQLTEDPVVSEKDPAEFRSMLGPDYDWLSKALKTEGEVQTLRRVQSETGIAFAWSLTSTRIARALGRLFVDSTARAGETYTYRVTYVGFNGKEIARHEQTARMESGPIRPPGDVRGEPGNEQVKLSWSYPEYTADPTDNVMGFNIYRSGGDSAARRVNEVLVLRQSGKLARVDDKLQGGITYRYAVKAVDWMGRESEPSASVAVLVKDIHPPEAPKGLKATPREGSIRIDWEKGPEPDLLYYDIYRGLSVQGEFARMNARPILSLAPSYVDSAVRFGPYYFYKIKAVDRSGNESKFTAAHPARPIDSTPPVAVSGFTATIQGTAVHLQWARSVSADVAGYRIYRGSQPANMLRLGEDHMGRDTLSYHDQGYHGKGMPPGSTLFYGVSAIDDARNESPKSTVLVRIPDTEAPEPPADFHAHPTASGLVELGWQRSPSPDVASFRIYRLAERDSLKLIAATRQYSYTDSTARKGGMYTYQLSAIDSSGNESKAAGPVRLSAGTTYLAPPPAGLRAATGPRGVTVSWNGVDPRELQGYNIYRSSKPSGIFEKLNDRIITSTTFTDPAGKPAQFYRVSSVTTSGRESRSKEVARAY